MALEHRGYKVQLNKDSLIEGTHREYSLGIFGNAPFGESGGPQIYETSMRCDEKYLHPPDPCTIYGYFQSERYMAGIESQVRHRFQSALGFQLSPRAVEMWNKIHQSDSVAVHVRRQDYINLQHIHGLPSIDYYREGIKFICQQRFDAKVFIFSDDTQWCHENFPQDFTFVQGTNKYEDLRLMSSCNHAVIANSSFSWWGAWLQQKLDGIVVAPKRWFADPNLDSSDIVPSRWVKL
jgi:hypothetical protein